MKKVRVIKKKTKVSNPTTAIIKSSKTTDSTMNPSTNKRSKVYKMGANKPNTTPSKSSNKSPNKSANEQEKKQRRVATVEELAGLVPERKWPTQRLTRLRCSYDGPFKWTPAKVQAAKMLAEGNYNTTQIAEALGVSPATIYYWSTFKKFWNIVEKQVLETGLARESDRAAHIKKRIAQLNQMLDPRLDPNDEFYSMLANNVPTEKLVALEIKLLEILEKRNKTPDEIHHTFSTLNPDEQKVSALEDLIKSLSPSAADEVKVALIQRSANLIKKRKAIQELQNSHEEE